MECTQCKGKGELQSKIHDSEGTRNIGAPYPCEWCEGTGVQSRIRPFHCGSEYGDWVSSNCDQCAKEKDCPIAMALSDAYMNEGFVSLEMGRRAGREDDSSFACTERVHKSTVLEEADDSH